MPSSSGTRHPVDGVVSQPEAPPKDGFGTVRLVAALVIIVDHAAVLTGVGGSVLPAVSGVDLGAVAVGAFMALSGYFVMRAWQRDSNLWRFWVRRLVRIMPGLLVALAVAALVLGPLVTTLGTRKYLDHPATWTYITDNLLLFPQQYVLPGVFRDNHYPHAVNGSLWSLPVEILGYVLVVVIGLLVTFTRRRFVVVVVAMVLAVLLQRMYTHHIALPKVLLMVPTMPLLQYLGMYAVGAAMWLYRDKLRLSWFGVLLCVGIDFTMYGSAMVEVIRVFTIPYVVLTVGRLLPRRLWLPSSMTVANYGVYLYGFPTLQTLIFLGVGAPWLVAAASVPISLALGLLSWHVVEKQAMKLRKLLIGAPRGPSGLATARDNRGQQSATGTSQPDVAIAPSGSGGSGM